MEKIRLNKREKALLRFLGDPANEWRDTPDFRFAMYGLEEYGLAQCRRDERGGVVDARLTIRGKAYLETNPKLRNPLFSLPAWDANMVIIVCSLLTIICVFIRIFVKLKMR